MSDTLHTDDAENSAEADDEGAETYTDSEGEPLRCPDCGEFVAVHYRPQEEYAARNAGFYAHCDCALGPELSRDSVEHFAPKWFAKLVLETEEDGEDWLEYYCHDNQSLGKWVDASTATKTGEEEIVEALQEAEYGDQIGVKTESYDLTVAFLGGEIKEENMENRTLSVTVEVKGDEAPWDVANLRWHEAVDSIRLDTMSGDFREAEEVESIKVISDE